MNVPQLLPADINAEVLMAYFPEGECRVSFSGLHKRNSYCDVVEMEQLAGGGLHLTLGRNSLYNALPECMFHPIDRFDNLPKSEEKERFEQQLEEQAEEMENAYRFFAPIDVLLVRLRSQVREKIEVYAKEDVVMQRILGDSITEQQRGNRFVRKLLPFLPQCRFVRGNRTLLTLMLRKIFLEEGLAMDRGADGRWLEDSMPRYADGVDMEVGEGFVGNVYADSVVCYRVHYWSEQECGEGLLGFLDELEELRLFVKDYFLSVEEDLLFDVSCDGSPVCLGEEGVPHYLNYNVNI